MSRHLYGIHDASADWAGIVRDFGMSGWAVISEEIGDNPTNYSGNDYNYLAAYGVTPIVRLNYSHHGQGTIPLATRYNAFAERCANFVTASYGCTHWIIGNEPNLRAERYDDVPITPASYADCFGKCRNQILHRSTQHHVIPAAIAPYNADTGWCLDYWREMLSAIVMTDGGADGLALHTYSRGPNPASVTSEDKMGAPYQNCYNGFRAYRNFLDLVPAIMRALPVYITETDQLEPWADTNSGWVQGAYAEINDWNGATGHQGIHCLALYRWENYDQWGFCQKHSVIDDFRNALTFGYEAPVPPWPQPPQPTPPTPAPEPARDIDPRLLARGVNFIFALPPAGTGYWRMTKAEWLEDAANQVGPDHHILGQVLRDGQETAGVPLYVEWPSGDTIITSKADDPNASYNYDYAMSASLNEYSILVADGNPSDGAAGIGMGKDGNPKEHTSTWITWSWTISEGEVIPIPPEPEPTPQGKLIWPVSGPITQPFGANPAYYAQYGQAGHNGIDIGCPEGTPVVAIADGEVMYTGWDENYGHYVRVYHDSIHSHSFCAHNSVIYGVPGELVFQGEVLAASGNTGNSTGPHCHFELRSGTRDAYYEGVTYGYSNGRYNPVDAYVVTGSALDPGVGL